VKTQIKLDRAVGKLAQSIVRNAFGDLIGCPKGAEIIAGQYGRSLPACLRASEVLAWRRGKPRKRVVYIATAEVLRLTAEVAASSKATRAADAAAALRADAAAAGVTVAVHRRALRVQAAADAVAAIAADAARAADDLRQWTDAVREITARRAYPWSEGTALTLVIDKLRSREGVARAWFSGEFDGGREAFVCCVLGAADRHQNTNYEELLSAGMGRDDARDLRERY